MNLLNNSHNLISIENPCQVQSSLLLRCSTCPGGRSCSKCLAGFYEDDNIGKKIALDLLYIGYKNTQNNGENDSKIKRSIKSRLAFIKIITGIEVNTKIYGAGRMFTLSESNEAVEAGLSFPGSVKRFRNLLSSKYSLGANFWLEHHPPPGKPYRDFKGISRLSQGHYNRHFVVFGTGNLNPYWLGETWERIHLSKVSGLELIQDSKGAASYLSNYLKKSGEEFVKARFSHDWLFPQWFEFSQRFKRIYGYYPSVEYLTEAKLLGKVNTKNQLAWLKLIGWWSDYQTIEDTQYMFDGQSWREVVSNEPRGVPFKSEDYYERCIQDSF